MGLNKILLIDVAGIGDTVMSIPALRALRQANPRSCIVVLVSPRAKGLLENCPYIDEVFTFDRARPWLSFGLLWRLRREKFDAALNLYHIASLAGSRHMRALFAAINPVLSAGRVNAFGGAFYDLRVKDIPGRHVVESKLAAAGLLGAVGGNDTLELWITPEQEVLAQDLLRKNGILATDNLAGISPTSYSPNNTWPSDKTAAIADGLIERYGLKVLLLGPRSSAAHLNNIAGLMKNKPLMLNDQVEVTLLAALIKQLRLLISVDSGPVHIAAVFKTPTVALFSGQDPAVFGPYHNERAIVLHGSNACWPCGNRRVCVRRDCVRAVDSESVISAAKLLLNI